MGTFRDGRLVSPCRKHPPQHQWQAEGDEARMAVPRGKPDLGRAVGNLRDRMIGLRDDCDRVIHGFGEQSVGFALLEARAFLQKAISAIDENQERGATAKADL